MSHTFFRMKQASHFINDHTATVHTYISTTLINHQRPYLLITLTQC